jgi:hypothetical protein
LGFNSENSLFSSAGGKNSVRNYFKREKSKKTEGITLKKERKRRVKKNFGKILFI